jgi:hypothetical protein
LLADHVLPRWGKVEVGAIDAKVIRSGSMGWRETHQAETVHHAYTALRQCLKVAFAHKQIATSRRADEEPSARHSEHPEARHRQVGQGAGFARRPGAQGRLRQHSPRRLSGDHHRELA